MLNRKLLVSIISFSVFSLCSVMQTAYASAADSYSINDNINVEFVENLTSSGRLQSMQGDVISHGRHCYFIIFGNELFVYHC